MESTQEILGRAAELDVLRRFIAEVPDGPRSFVLAGEPGIGKTTLWRTAVTEARARGYRVLTCRPIGAEVQLSFAALGDLLADVLDDTLTELPTPQRDALESALLLEESRGSVDRRSIAVGVLSVLRILASREPVVVAVDDIQWLDRPTVGVLSFALRRLREEPVALLASVRAESKEPPDDLEEAFPDERRTRLLVKPLSLATLHRLVRERLDVALPRPLLLTVHRTSRGNPFYALELVRALDIHHSPFAGERLPVPGTLRELLQARLAVLPRTTRERLLAVACLSEATLATVDAVTPSQAQGRGWLERAVVAGVLEHDDDRITFTHPLLASSVYFEASAERRRRMHRRLAAVLDDPEARARHLALSVSGPDAEAASLLEQAARHASGQGASDAAADLLELAIELTPERGVADRRRRELQAAIAHLMAGAHERGMKTLRRLADDLEPGSRRADVLVRLGWGEDDLEGALELGEQALRESGEDDALLSRAHLVIGAAGWPLRGIDTSIRHGRLALRHAEASGEATLVIQALARLANWYLWAGKNPARLLNRALELADKSDATARSEQPSLPLQAGPLMTLALWRMYQGRHREARTVLETLLREASASGDEPGSVAIHGRLADVALRAGDWRGAEAHAALAYELAEQLGLEHDGGLAVYFRAFVDAHRGRAAEATAAADAGVSLARAANQQNTLAMVTGVLGFLEISRGNEASALPHMEPLLAWLAKTNLALAPHPMAPYALEALIAAGQLDEARALTACFEGEAHRLRGPWMLAIGARCRGLIAAAEGDLPTAFEAMAASLSYHVRGDWPFERARTLLALGHVQRRARQKGDARRSCEEALALFEALPAPLWSERARAELARLGLRRSSSGELTESERRVAELAGSGLTNRDVAAKLYMSPKTVEAHLARAYRKLGIHSRAQLGARLSSLYTS